MRLLNKAYTHFKKDSLYRNSIYLMASTGVLAIFGFFFWVIAARLFITEEVGIATTLISTATLIASFSLLGLNVSLNRYLPKSENRNEMISTSFIIVGLASIIVTAIFLLKVELFSLQLLFIRDNIVYMLSFIIFILVLSTTNLLDSIYMAYRASENILIRNTILGVLKILFIFLFISIGAYGIFSSFATAASVSFIVSMGILIYKYNFHPFLGIKTDLVKKMGIFSIGNYISGFLYQAPALILPIIIINTLHAKVAAYYYIDSMILNLLIIIPTAASQSLFTEGSHNKFLIRDHLKKAIKITVLLFLPSILIILFFGGFILRFFGESYQADAFKFLQIISLSSIFMTIVLFGNAILRIHNKIKILILFNLIGCAIILISSYSFVSHDLEGIGWGWTIGQMIVALLYLLYLLKSKIYSLT